jgi:hypothetical protein
MVDILKRYAVRVEVYVDAEHPYAAQEQVEQLMDPLQGAPWLIRHVRGMTPADQQLLDEKYSVGESSSSGTPS